MEPCDEGRREAVSRKLSAPPVLDPEGARLHATRTARKLGEGCKHFLGNCNCDPPHYLRCDFMYKGERCRRGDGHFGPHKFK